MKNAKIKSGTNKNYLATKLHSIAQNIIYS